MPSLHHHAVRWGLFTSALGVCEGQHSKIHVSGFYKSNVFVGVQLFSVVGFLKVRVICFFGCVLNSSRLGSKHTKHRRKHPSLGPARCYLRYARSGLLLRSFNRRVDPSRSIDIVDRWLSWGWFSTSKGKMESVKITMKWRGTWTSRIFFKPPFLFFHVLVSY